MSRTTPSDFGPVAPSAFFGACAIASAWKRPNALSQTNLRHDATRRWLWYLRMDGTVQQSVGANLAQSSACLVRISSNFSTPEVAANPLPLPLAAQDNFHGV